LAEKHHDGLHRERPVEHSSERVEPQLESAHSAAPDEHTARAPDEESVPAASFSSAAAAAAQNLPAVPGFDPGIDYIAAIDAPEPVSAAGLAELHGKAAAGGRRFRVAGFNPATHAWEEAGRLSGGRYAHLRVAVQLVSRKGLIEAQALSAICDAVQACAAKFSASAHCPDIDEALKRARELDAYCADVDVAIGVNVVPATSGESFAGTRIRALAESAGFKLEPDGLFHYRDDTRQTVFTLDNQEPAPFVADQMKHLNTTGVTLVLDVPRVADADTALDLMLKTGSQLAAGLGGALVDDNRVALTDTAVRVIQQQLHAIHGKMEARGMSPGSERTLRLFS
jgi:hypothetical protein